ncbi:MAG: FtsX-like permease family protein, partial [Planctomycetes bacterium]|nr:FtsX-like permease family protein [Planctomycetota bacterium]
VGRDFNLDIHVPLTTAQARFGDAVVRISSGSRSSEEVQIREVIYEASSRDRVLSDAAMLKRAVQVRHPKMDDVQFVIPYQLLEDARSAALRWQLVLAAIAAISLLVGGVGIMNIMLASVTERTREIGIRRALGATRKHIVWQFLVETSVLSAVGGLMGVAAGIGLSLAIGWGAKRLFAGAELTTSIPLWSVLVSFIAAALTGLVAGIYPARQAARQDPIVALRHD